MGNTRVEIGVGLFMLAGLACLVYLAVRLGDVDLFGSDRYALDARFVSSSGLKPGAFVEVGGVRVGKVADIRLDPETYESVVRLELEPSVRLQDDAIASIRTEGIIGDKFVKITPGGSPQLLGPGDTIFETESSISLEELISKYIFESGKD
ncbi:MAG: outer membrane lipid asymmetry maintenance protein MlaD [Sinobacteraceae bacterium]|nr:outer membrane lipid asymmetry maintenance protein MlaD [Nevskiaceae bacterium]